MAEREGFEPPIGLHLCRISSAVHSTTLPPLQGAINGADIRPVVGRCSRRGWRARQGAGNGKFRIGKTTVEKSGTAGRDKTRRPLVASLKFRPGSAASPVG